MSFEETLECVRALCGRVVTATLFGADGGQIARWEGVLAEEELDAQAVADRLERRVAGQPDAELRVRALRNGDVALFTVGDKPLVIDRIDTTSAERLEPEGVRMRDPGGATVELVPV